MVAVWTGALAGGEETREIGVAARTLFDAGFDAGTGRWKFEVAVLAVLIRATAFGTERRERGAAFEAMFLGIFDFRFLIFD